MYICLMLGLQNMKYSFSKGASNYTLRVLIKDVGKILLTRFFIYVECSLEFIIDYIYAILLSTYCYQSIIKKKSA